MRKLSFFLICLLLISTLSGCGKDESLTQFETDMNQFKENIKKISEEMDAIDPTSDTASQDLLACLTKMNEEFQFLANISVPAKFSNIEQLADDASSYMQASLELYTQAYANDTYDENLAATASENYSRAMKRVQYISELLQGKVPDGTEVSITEEDGIDFTPVTEDSSPSTFHETLPLPDQTTNAEPSTEESDSASSVTVGSSK